MIYLTGLEDSWRRERLPTPVLWPGEFHGLYSPRGCKESDTTERLTFTVIGHLDYFQYFEALILILKELP